ncbi:hypothetical protein COY95_02420, partial [Candidatus Woesearchaeota archaeon CG_4_10_14_0_8_um_filter_47_5]
EGSQTRFEKARSIAHDHLGQKNTIILIKGTPALIAQDVGKAQARKFINAIRPTQSLSNIGDAMLMVGDVVEDKDAEVLVLSDFIPKEGTPDPLIAKNILASQGYDVELINVGSAQGNVGFVDMTLEEGKALVSVKNFADHPAPVQIKNTDVHLMLEPHSLETFSIDLEPGITQFELQTENDGLPADNILYLSVPEEQQRSVLFVTQTKSSYVRDALSSMENLHIEYVEPPILPQLNYNIVVIDQVQPGSILTGTFDEIRERVERDGQSLIIMGQPDIARSFDFKGLFPLTASDQVAQDSPIVNTEAFNSLKNINFGVSSVILKGGLISNTTIVLAETPEGVPVITITKLGKGYVVYYGIVDEKNSFRLSPDYPVFWIELLNILKGREDVQETNLRIGQTISVKKGGALRTPSNTRITQSIFADEVGFYTLDSKKIAANLLNQEESSLVSTLVSEQEDEFSAEPQETIARVKTELMPVLIGLGLLFLFIELVVIKRRGDV